MKKLLTLILACILLTSCALAADSAAALANDPADSSIAPETTEPLNDVAKEPLIFDADIDTPQFPWPVQRLSYQIYVDHPFVFEYTKETDDLNGKPINWQPVEPITLYQIPDDSWTDTVTDDNLNVNELRQKQFYLVEPGCYYRVIADYSNRTANIRPVSYPIAKYLIHDIYSGMLKPGRTGAISLELDEQVGDVCVIHRCRLNIASVNGINILPQAYATNINGNVIITYYPTPEAEWKDHYSDTSVDLIFSEGTVATPIYNVAY